MRHLARSFLLVGLFSALLAACLASGNGPGPGEGSGGTTDPGAGGTQGGAGGKGGAAGKTGSGGTAGVVTGSGGKGSGGRGSGGVDCNPGSGTLDTAIDPWAYAVVQGLDGTNCRRYVLQTNVWGASAQEAMTYSGPSFTITKQTGSGNTSGAPASYPSVFIGSNNNHTSGSASNLPKAVSSITSIPTTFDTNANSCNCGNYNASYDVWFSTSSAGDAAAPSGGYLMVWLYKPSGAQPIGGTIASNVTIPGVSGTFNVWSGDNGGKPCISYVSTSNVNSMTFDLKAFISDAVSRGKVQNSWYLTNVFGGFEIWSGGVGLKVNKFSAVVN